MTFAYVGVHVENFACEISKAQNVVALCRIDRKLSILESITRLEFDNTSTVHEKVEMRTKLAVRIRTGANIEKKHHGFLQLQECTGIRQLAFSAVRNNGPA